MAGVLQGGEICETMIGCNYDCDENVVTFEILIAIFTIIKVFGI